MHKVWGCASIIKFDDLPRLYVDCIITRVLHNALLMKVLTAYGSHTLENMLIDLPVSKVTSLWTLSSQPQGIFITLIKPTSNMISKLQFDCKLKNNRDSLMATAWGEAKHSKHIFTNHKPYTTLWNSQNQPL